MLFVTSANAPSFKWPLSIVSELTSNTQIPQTIIRHKPHHLVQLPPLLRLVLIQLPQPPQPAHLRDLLRKEECRDEIRLRTPEGQIGVVDVFHVGGREHAVVLGGEVDEEAGGGEVAGGAVGDSHFEG
jgi:hypothetical protein